MIHKNVDEAMTAVLANILHAGAESSPRGRRVVELIGQTVAFDMRYPIITKLSRAIGYRFYAAEAAWILHGRNDLRFFAELKMPFIWEFSDDGLFYQGAYGPQVIEQLSYVCDTLINDIDTRQAVMTVWRQNPRPSRDIPCTLSYQFLIRGGALHCVQSMRSSDVWLGYPYDAFNASMLSAYIILILRHRKGLRLSLGNHTLVVGSQHIYEAQWEQAREFVSDDTAYACKPFEPLKYEGPNDFLDSLLDFSYRPDGVNPKTMTI